MKQEQPEDIDTSTSKSHWSSKSKGYIVKQLELRGFENNRQWSEIKKKPKTALLKIIQDLIDDDQL